MQVLAAGEIVGPNMGQPLKHPRDTGWIVEQSKIRNQFAKQILAVIGGKLFDILTQPGQSRGLSRIEPRSQKSRLGRSKVGVIARHLLRFAEREQGAISAE